MSEVFRGRHYVYVEITGLNSSVKFVCNALIGSFQAAIICDQACNNRPPECKRIIYTITAKSLSLLRNLMGFLLKLTEMGYYTLNGEYLREYNTV